MNATPPSTNIIAAHRSIDHCRRGRPGWTINELIWRRIQKEIRDGWTGRCGGHQWSPAAWAVCHQRYRSVDIVVPPPAMHRPRYSFRITDRQHCLRIELSFQTYWIYTNSELLWKCIQTNGIRHNKPRPALHYKVLPAGESNESNTSCCWLFRAKLKVWHSYLYSDNFGENWNNFFLNFRIVAGSLPFGYKNVTRLSRNCILSGGVF